MAFGINFFNTPAQIKKLPIQEPNQIEAINEQLAQGRLNANPDIQEKYARQQFAQQIPGIAERLNMASGGQQRGQAANYELGGLQANLESQLAGQRYQTGLRQLQLGLTPQNEYLYQPEKQGLAESATQNLIGGLADKFPDLAYKAGQLGYNKLFGGNQNQQGPVSQVTQTGQTANQLAASATEQALNNLTPPGARTAADLVPQSSGNMAADAFNNPSLTPFARQALEKTVLQQPSAAATALQQVGKGVASGAATGAASSALGKVGAGLLGAGAAATAPAWLPAALALGVPAAIGLAGYGAVRAYDWYQDRKKRKAEQLKNNRRSV